MINKDAYLRAANSDSDIPSSHAFKNVAARVAACAASGYERPWISQDLNELQPLAL